MRHYQKRRLYTPSDLVTFLGCRHATFLDLQPKTIKKSEIGSTATLLQEKGVEHEQDYLKELKHNNKTVMEIPKNLPLDERLALTTNAMRSGYDVVYQAVLLKNSWHGDADFLIKISTASDLGNFSYEVLDAKLAKVAEPKHIIQLSVYSELLEALQGLQPHAMHLFLGDKKTHSFSVSDFLYYVQQTQSRFEHYINQVNQQSSPEPCKQCTFCQWHDTCKDYWKKTDDLSLVANIQRSQMIKLRQANITTLQKIAESSTRTRIPDLNPDVFARLVSQASLQNYKAKTGKNKYELIKASSGKGFARLPKPHAKDLFFDMEGDPLYPNGLEYLFGIHYIQNHKKTFKAFWAHDHYEEKITFENFMDFLDRHLTNHPDAYVYHYNHYETTALKRLACRYATREEQLDHLLRAHKFVDLYLVVRENIRISEPGYSIKNLETFYDKGKRKQDAVATAVDSIIVYNRWRELGGDNLLKEIQDYNQVDCESTEELRNWLLELRPDMEWFIPQLLTDDNEITNKNKEKARSYREINQKNYTNKLSKNKGLTKEMNEHISHLLGFHNREAKPQWWSHFERQNKFDDELIDDPECLGGLSLIESEEGEKNNIYYTYTFPEQAYKLKAGTVNLIGTKKNLTLIDINDKNHTVTLKAKDPLEDYLSIGPTGPINTQIIEESLYYYADYVLNHASKPHVATELLACNSPRIHLETFSDCIVKSENTLQKDALDTILNLDHSYLFIQGPPGAGKTYNSSHIIINLIKQGKKIGITSNSHKAIHNLLHKIESIAIKEGVMFKGVKKASSGNPDSNFNSSLITSVTSIAKMDLNATLFAGTVWTFSNKHFYHEKTEPVLDYLFIDEAGQVAVANIIAMANSCKNIILVGDQMQLGQPTQGTHPGKSGLSILEFLLEDYSTIPADRGIFLAQTRRMRPSVCHFISKAFYDGKLHAHQSTTERNLDLSALHLPNEGIGMIHVQHKGCSQKSIEEGNIIQKLYTNLLGQYWSNNLKKKERICENDILVVTPYNVQVTYLKSVLGNHAKIGTVDKFQGQEAAIVLISMVSSSAEDLPRNIDFLYSKNRLNVAISRAQCLAIIIMNPQLLEIPCRTIQQMKLVNTFCWLNRYAKPIQLTF